MSAPKERTIPGVRSLRSWVCAVGLLGLTAAACSRPHSGSSGAASASNSVIRITGSDTMVNLVQAWAEAYRKVRPDIAVQVAGGGSGVGFAGLIDGILDLAAASREIEPSEIEAATKRNGQAPKEFRVALDALAIYANRQNPLDALSMEDLAEIYGENGRFERWSQLGVDNAACRTGKIIRVGRQNNSGTYAYFRDALLGRTREMRMGSIDQSGSKDVVALVSRTPCAIGYSGMGYMIPEVKQLKLSKKRGESAVLPTAENAINGSYPLARALYLYAREEPAGTIGEFLDWVLSAEAQAIVQDTGYVPIGSAGRQARDLPRERR